jgi:uncharacterized protein YqeY
MSLELQINNDIKAAMLSKDREKLEALRAIKAALLLAKTGKDVTSGEIPHEVELAMLQKLVKQRREAAEIYLTQNRKDLADPELFQADIISKYLPEQMSENDVRIVVNRIIAETGAAGMKDMGKVMAQASNELKGKADNKLISGIVKACLV